MEEYKIVLTKHCEEVYYVVADSPEEAEERILFDCTIQPCHESWWYDIEVEDA